MKNIWFLLLLFFTGCATVEDKTPRVSDAKLNDEQLIEQGQNLLASGSTQKAIDDYFNPVIDHCDALFKNSKTKTYGARNLPESMYYMLLAATAKVSAQVVSPTCGNALYFKGYASLDLGKIDEAMVLFKKAIEFSPVNSRYLSELGNLYQVQKEWDLALKTFGDAEEYAAVYSPENAKTEELTRAKRGLGYSLIELGKLDDAEKKFQECLEINKDDKNALHELEYIKILRKKQQ